MTSRPTACIRRFGLPPHLRRNPEVLRRIWEDADARHRRKSQPETLASALRYLHRRAGSPTPPWISVSSGHVLPPDHIAGLLNGTTTGALEDIQLLVQALDGEYTYFEPLWHQATAERTTPSPAGPWRPRGGLPPGPG
ncbi:hypothetical protein [Streptomyces sp. NPDC088146]|uniref:hypothetical protein n=1 Tax=Streptomyces sp. NPDC088146 TaxID=3365829 RepID=UPI00381EEF59